MARNVRPEQIEAAALVIATGGTTAQAAKAAGVSDRAIRRWRATKPRFQQRVDELRRQLADDALGRVVESLTAASDALRALLGHPRATIRLAAARALFQVFPGLSENLSIDRRLALIERAAQPGDNDD